MTDSEYRVMLAENAAALSANMHTHDRYSDLYDIVGPVVGGFPGIWRVCVDLAVEVTDQEATGRLDFANGELDWIGFMDVLAHSLVMYMIEEKRAPDATATLGLIDYAVRYELDRSERKEKTDEQ